MTKAFGDLIRYRRHTLTLTLNQLAQRMNARGHAVDVAALEDGHPAPQTRGFLNALARALEWRVGTLRVARDFPADAQSPADADKTPNLHAMDEGTMIREEMVDVQDLHLVLLRWTDELEDRASDLKTGTPAEKAARSFDA